MNLKDKNLYLIGGIVRDEILNMPSFDVDLVYDGDAVEFAKSISDAEIVQINEPFGTVKIKLKNITQNEIFKTLKQVLDDKIHCENKDIEIDIASTRSEIYPQKGHLPVIEKIGCSLREDVMRRDFTINAMAKSALTGEIIDYTSGLEDIKTKTLRVLHDKSFIDDPTRIVRMLKFAVRFGFEPDMHTKELQDNYLANINYDMSYKRLKKELIETFNLNKWNAFEKFVNQKIYKLVAPQEFNLPKYNFSPLIEKLSPDNIWIIYIGLLPDISNLPLTKTEKLIVEEYNKLLHHFAANDKKFLTKVQTDNQVEKSNIDSFEIYKAFKNIPIESVIMYSTINHEMVERYLNELKDIKISIDGNDLKSLGIEPSPNYQRCFDFVLKKKIENPKLTKSDEIKLAKDFFKVY